MKTRTRRGFTARFSVQGSKSEEAAKNTTTRNPEPGTLNHTGFTLIELMVVVIIIAALASMVLPRLLPRADEAKKDIARGDIANITMTLKLYRLDNDEYPLTTDGLEALMSKPTSAKNWKGPYLEKKPTDPWKRKYEYKCPGAHNSSGFDLWSRGPKEDDATDDVTNWEE